MSFKDLYTESQYVVPIGAKTSVSLNGIDLRSFGFELTQMPDLAMPATRQRNVTIDGRSGSVPMGDLYQNWSFSLVGQLVGLNLEDAMRKKDNLLKWIDIEQNNLTKFVIGDKEFLGLNFQINGAPLYYSTGTVAVNSSSSKEVTGTGTSFKNYVSTGTTFEVHGDDTIYTVQSITDDNTLHLLENITRANGTGLAYRIERKRYLVVNYNGSSSISPVVQRGILSEAAPGQEKHVAFNLSIGFYSVYPYWIGDIFDHEITSTTLNFQSNNTDTSGVVTEIKGLGNAPVSPKYVFEGIANQPEITSGELSLHAKFDGVQTGRVSTNKTTVAPTSPMATPVYKPFKNHLGIQSQGSSSDIEYRSMCRMNLEGSFLVRLDASSIGANSNLFPLWIGQGDFTSNKFIRVYITGSTSNLIKLQSRNGSSIADWISVTLPNYMNSNFIELSGWWNQSGRFDSKNNTTYYAKLFLNGEIIGTATENSAYPYDDYLDSVRVGYSSASNTDVVLGEVAVFKKSLSDEKIRSFYYSTESIFNNNKTFTYSSNVGTNDILIYDSMTGNSDFYKQSAGSKINVMSNVSGKAPVLLGDDIDESANLHFHRSSGNSINKVHVIYRPHFR